MGLMDMRVNTVSIDYFKQMISKSKLKLEEPRLSESVKVNIRDMQNVFGEYIDEEKKRENVSVSLDQMLRDLSDKMCKDLDGLKLSVWKNIQVLCWSVRKYNAPQINYHKDSIDVEDLVSKTLKIYDKSDKQFYHAAKSIFSDKHTLIYLNELDVNNYYRCRYLQRNFIACDQKGYNAYPSFIHETQHSIDHKLFYNIPALFGELGPIFFETLMNDSLNKSGNYIGIYGERINDHNQLMKDIYDYVRVLEKFENKGRTLTIENAGSILEVEDEAELAALYSFYNNDDAIDSVKYILSFMKAIQIRDLYYNSKKEGIARLKDAISGNDLKINYASLINDYEYFLKELETKSKVKKF